MAAPGNGTGLKAVPLATPGNSHDVGTGDFDLGRQGGAGHRAPGWVLIFSARV